MAFRRGVKKVSLTLVLFVLMEKEPRGFIDEMAGPKAVDGFAVATEEAVVAGGLKGMETRWLLIA